MKFIKLFSDNGICIHEYLVNANKIIYITSSNDSGLLKHGSEITLEGMDMTLYSSKSPYDIKYYLEEDS